MRRTHAHTHTHTDTHTHTHTHTPEPWPNPRSPTGSEDPDVLTHALCVGAQVHPGLLTSQRTTDEEEATVQDLNTHQ